MTTITLRLLMYCDFILSIKDNKCFLATFRILFVLFLFIILFFKLLFLIKYYLFVL